MDKVIDLAARRAAAARNRGGLPSRAPELELDIWLTRLPGTPYLEVECVRAAGSTGEPWASGVLRDVLLDSAWLFAGEDKDLGDADRTPAVWIHLERNGQMTWIYPKTLFRGTSRAQALWLLRWTWRITRRLLYLTWCVARAQAPKPPKT